MRNLILFLILISSLAFGASFNDSVLVGGSGPANSKAQLEVKSTTKGVLLPRGTTTQMNAISSPPEGLLFYNNSTHELSIYDGITWQAMFDAGNLTGTLPAGSVPAPTASTLGGVFSKSVVSHQFITGIGTGTGSPSSAQPAFTDLTGTCTVAQGCVALISATLGDLIYGSATNTWSNLVGNITSTKKFLSQTGTGSVSAAPTWIQPACGDLSNAASSCSVDATNAANIGTGTLSPARMPNPTSSSLGGVQSAASALHQWINSISTSGAPALSQPAFSDVSGSVAASQMPALTGDVTSSAGAVATTVVKIQGVSVATTSPTSGQVLTYNNLTSKWDPENSGLNGVLTVSSGGTGNSSLTNHGMLVGAGTTSITVVPPDASTTKVWTSGGASADPSWQPPAGGLIGPGSSTDTAIALWNGTAGTTIKNSTVLVDTSGNISTSGDTTSIKIASVTDPTSVLSMAYNQTNTRAEIQTLQTSTNTGRALFIGTADVGGSNANNTGKVTVGSGSKTAGTGSSGDVELNTGTSVGGIRGRVNIVDGTESYPGTVWTQINNSGGGHWQKPTGDINFISNPDAEYQGSTSTPGWATYADAAGVTPIDCTGGASTVTWTRTTSSPLSGAGSFLFTKDAANRQGNGASYDFSIRTADKAKVMQIEFDYVVASGTFVAGSSGVDSDIEWYVYDVTNGGSPIQPTVYKLASNATSPASHFTAQFQSASNSTSYRLCAHTATTSASAYTVQFDSLTVSPSRYAYGTPVSDWAAYTPTWSSAGTPPAIGNGTITGAWRRVGANMQVRLEVLSGTTTTYGSANAYTFSLPTGYTADYSIVDGTTSVAILGMANARNTSSLTYATGAVVRGTALTNVSVAQTGGNNTYWLSTLPGTWTASAANQTITLAFEVPILGWSSSVQMNDSAPQAVVSFYGTQATQAVTADVTDLTLTSVKDSHGGWATNIYTVKVPGDYTISGTLICSAACAPHVFKNASGFQYWTNVGAGVLATSGATYLPDLKAGDTISMRSSASVTVTGASIGIARTGGPVSIGATETIAAHYHNSATSISGSLATISWTTSDFDTHSGMSAGTYTLQLSGKYHVDSCVALSAASSAAGNAVDMQLQKNGSVWTEVAPVYQTTQVAMPVCISDDISGNAGDTIRIQLSSGATTPAITSSNSKNFFSIHRVGL